MKKTLLMSALLATISCFADEAPSKDEMKKNLEDYVKKNQEASVQIMPLIERVRELLKGKENTPPGKEGRTPATEPAHEQAN